MTAPMPETMSPREKVAHLIDNAPDHQTADELADAILAALASSGDHAELARAIDRLLPITIQNTPDYAEVSFGECRAQAMTLEPETWLALNQLPALIAENAALRDRLETARIAREAHNRQYTEAERKLAEAVGHMSWMSDHIHAWAVTEERLSEINTFLSKEAERG
nr:hypothetical protein [Enterobacter roggenkampii]